MHPEHRDRTYKKIDLPNLLEYYISTDGEILFHKGKIIRFKHFIKLFTPGYSSKHRLGWIEKNPSVFLKFKNGRTKKIKIHKLILIAYRGNRGPEFEAIFKDKDGKLDLNNLEWKLKKNISLFDDILTDEEFLQWKEKSESIPRDERDKYNSYVLGKYLKKSRKYYNRPWDRESFFNELFKPEFDGWKIKKS